MQVSRRYRAAVLGLVPFLLMACRSSSGPATVPGAGQTPAPLSGTAALRDVRVAARPPRDSRQIYSHISPVRVRLENRSDVPLMIRYRGLALVGADGTPTTALPLFPIEPGAAAPVPPGVLPRLSLAAYPPIDRPEFDSRNFSVAPYLQRLYPTLSAYEGDFPYDRSYSVARSGGWGDSSLPNLDMIRQAVPEGVVNPGGWVEGWVYFDRTGPVLRTDVVDSRSGRILGRIPTPIRGD